MSNTQSTTKTGTPNAPEIFEKALLVKAQASKQHIVFPEGEDDRILKACDILFTKNVISITILGRTKDILASAERLGLENIKKMTLIDPTTSPKLGAYANKLYEIRKSKGMTAEEAKSLVQDPSYWGVMMVAMDEAQGMVSGANHSTQDTVRPALQIVKTKPGQSIVSSIFFMALPDRILVFGDCAINPEPTPEELAGIAIASADSAAAFGIEPRVAMLSYSSGSSGKGAAVEKVIKATQIAKNQRPDLMIEGPIQYDAAVDPEIGQKKMPGSPVAGRANVFIFPDLNSGNITYKAVQREANCAAIGPMLQGLNKPVNDLSRGCTVDDIVGTAIITAIQAQQN